MNDGQLSQKNEHLQANYIVQIVLENLALADEFYCQIVNQTWQNKDRLAQHRGWKLMSDALSAIPPSPTISSYLLKYAYLIIIIIHNQILQYYLFYIAYTFFSHL